MASTTWTDPSGQVHQYRTTGTGLRADVQRALERQSVWRSIDPSFDTRKLQVGPTGQISEVSDWKDELRYGALTMAAPIGGVALSGLMSGGAAGGASAGAASGGVLPSSSLPASSLMAGPGAIASQGASAGVYGAAAAPAAASGLAPGVLQANQPAGVTGGTLPGTEAGLAAGSPKASTMALMDWLVPAISAGTGIAGALINKSAANNATDAQTEAADKALALTKEMYEQDRADYAPYRNIGAFSLGQLGHLTGMPKDFGTQAVAGATAPEAQAPGAAGPAPPRNVPANSRVGPAYDALWAQQQQAQRPELQTLRDLGATQQTASSFVRMRAPDGEEADVDLREVPMFERAGAMRI